MSGTIENIAKKWLIEPGYTKVFKHTADVIRFISALGSGDVVCIISGQDILFIYQKLRAKMAKDWLPSTNRKIKIIRGGGEKSIHQ